MKLSNKIKLGWVAYGGVRDVFKSDVPNWLKRGAVPTYGADTSTLTKASPWKLQKTQSKMKGPMRAMSLSGRLGNEDYRRRMGVDDVLEASPCKLKRTQSKIKDLL